jgi:hypothetical protein
MLPSRQAALLFATVVLGLFALGCGGGLVPFTQETRSAHNLSDDDVKNLQFYVSHRITLRRELEAGGSQVTGNHKLLVVSGKTIEEVVIEDETPGVALAVHDKSIAVSFEDGTSLEFTTGGRPVLGQDVTFAQAPDPFPGNTTDGDPQPFPVASDDGLGGRYWMAVERGGRVSFQGKSFAAIDDTLKAHLLIDSETLEEIVKNRKVLRGVRLPKK